MQSSTIKLLNTFDDSIIELDISDKNIYGVLDLNKFNKLEKLICSGNKITELKNLPKTTLKYLDCSHNQIGELTNNEIDNKLDYFSCKKNPLTKLFYPFDIKPKKYPKKLNTLIFDENFNQPVDNLPKTLLHLKFGDNFNQPVDNLPEGLKSLEFGDNFDQSIDVLPESLQILILGNNFNQSIDNIPSTITKLSFGENFDQSIDNLPSGLIQLVSKNIDIFSSIELPKKLKELIFDIEYDSLYDNNYFEIMFSIDLPKKIKKIYFGTSFVSTGMIDFEGHMNKDDVLNKYIFDIKIYWDYLNDFMDEISASMFNKKNSVINLTIGTYYEDISDPDCYNDFAKGIIQTNYLETKNDKDIHEYIEENLDLIKSEYEIVVKKYYTSEYPDLKLNISFVYHYSS